MMAESGVSATEQEGGRRDPKPRSARRRAREFALQAIYAWLVQSDHGQIGAIEAHVRDDPQFAHADAAWFSLIWQGVTQKAEGLREAFDPYLDRPVVELSPVEHAILLIGSFELTYQLDVPYRVAINESVELAKSFGGTDGFKFVNGVLDKLAPTVRAAEVNRGSARR
jgi:transcription antitermination protein NusB